MDLPLLSALFVTFALTLYVMLDGFDLGVGILLLLLSRRRTRVTIWSIRLPPCGMVTRRGSSWPP